MSRKFCVFEREKIKKRYRERGTRISGNQKNRKGEKVSACVSVECLLLQVLCDVSECLQSNPIHWFGNDDWTTTSARIHLLFFPLFFFLLFRSHLLLFLSSHKWMELEFKEREKRVMISASISLFFFLAWPCEHTLLLPLNWKFIFMTTSTMIADPWIETPFPLIIEKQWLCSHTRRRHETHERSSWDCEKRKKRWWGEGRIERTGITSAHLSIHCISFSCCRHRMKRYTQSGYKLRVVFKKMRDRVSIFEPLTEHQNEYMCSAQREVREKTPVRPEDLFQEKQTAGDGWHIEWLGRRRGIEERREDELWAVFNNSCKKKKKKKEEWIQKHLFLYDWTDGWKRDRVVCVSIVCPQEQEVPGSCEYECRRRTRDECRQRKNDEDEKREREKKKERRKEKRWREREKRGNSILPVLIFSSRLVFFFFMLMFSCNRRVEREGKMLHTEYDALSLVPLLSLLFSPLTPVPLSLSFSSSFRVPVPVFPEFPQHQEMLCGGSSIIITIIIIVANCM